MNRRGQPNRRKTVTEMGLKQGVELPGKLTISEKGGPESGAIADLVDVDLSSQLMRSAKAEILEIVRAAIKHRTLI